ncbi:DUF5017 domain-containing protein [Chitinophaga sp. OAE865]|uniref:DUF5017 domain-containing protein n=1 Tax=Chitinophaga sp. OAE865 TaxID=2817898 RepID=UPI001AE8A53A
MRSIIFYFLAAVMLSGCHPDEATMPDFDVHTDQLAYAAGDSITFHLSGNAGAIVFYSGEPGKAYENRNRKSMPGVEKLVFQTSMQQGPVPPKPCPDSLLLLISTNLEGYDAEHINKATWTNITGRNSKWPKSLSTGFTTSDSIDISDFNKADKVNIAFRVLNKKTGLTPQRKWVIQSFSLYNYLPDSSSTPLFTTFSNTGWVQASLLNDSEPGTAENKYTGFNAWNVGTWNISAADSARNSNGIPIRTGYPVTFNPGTNVNNEDNDDWLITSSVDLKTTRPDVGVVIQNEVALRSAIYKYAFKKAGTYQVTFVATNNSLKDSKSQIKQLTLKILP